MWKVRCTRSYCKFKGTLPDRYAAKEAAEEHEKATASNLAGSHTVEMREAGSQGSGTRRLISRRRF
jgi:hypothetical protein